MTLIRCPDCGRAVSDAAYECPACGRPIAGTPYGAQLPSPPLSREQQYALLPPHSGKEKTTAAVLALLLGGIGVHRFYLGRPVSGLVYLIFCFTFIPMLLSIAEFFRLLFMDEAEFHKKYARPVR